MLLINCNVRMVATPTRFIALEVVLVFPKGRRRSSNTQSRRHISLSLDGCHPGDLLVALALAEHRECQILPVCVLEPGNGLRDVVIYSAHVLQERLIWFLLCTQQLLDGNVGKIRGFEARKDIGGIQGRRWFLRVHFREMDCIKMNNHRHYVLPFRDSPDGKEILHLRNPQFNRDLGSSFEFG